MFFCLLRLICVCEPTLIDFCILSLSISWTRMPGVAFRLCCCRGCRLLDVQPFFKRYGCISHWCDIDISGQLCGFFYFFGILYHFVPWYVECPCSDVVLNAQSCQNLNRFLLDSYLWSWILRNNCKSAISSASSRNVIFVKRSRFNTSRQNVQLWNSQSLECRATSTNKMISAVIARPHGQDFPGKFGEARPDDYTSGKGAHMPTTDQWARFHLQPDLVPPWWASRTFKVRWNPWIISRSPRV